MVVNAGLAIISDLVSGVGGTVPKYVAEGTGSTAPAVTDTALGLEVETRATGTVSRVTTTATNDTMQVVGTVSQTGTHAITESGLFDASTSGNMLCRGTFTAVNVVSGDSIQFTWKVSWTGG